MTEQQQEQQPQQPEQQQQEQQEQQPQRHRADFSPADLQNAIDALPDKIVEALKEVAGTQPQQPQQPQQQTGNSEKSLADRWAEFWTGGK